jgi:putative heme-binding domain-containing protein
MTSGKFWSGRRPVALLPAALTVAFVAGGRVIAQSLPDAREANQCYALEHPGNPLRGAELFNDENRTQCANCHRVTGMEKSGPNLEGIADKYDPRELMRQMLYPSEAIAPGFEQVTIVTRAGRVYTGRLERANRTIGRLIDAQGQQTDIPTPETDCI